MKLKTITKTIAIALLLLILALCILFKILGTSAIKTAIEVAGTQTLKVPVTVGNVDLTLLTGNAGIDDLIIANPSGYAHENMIEMGKVRIDLAVTSLLSDTVRIESILLDQIHVTLEQKGLTNNIQQILKGLPKSGKKEEKQKDPETTTPQKKLEITKLELTNISVKVKLLPLPGKIDTLTLKLKPIVMENLGSESKLDVALLTSKILVAIVAGIAEQGAGILPDNITGPLGDSLKSLGAISGDFLESTGKILEDGFKEIGKGVEEIGKGLENLFKKKGGKND